MRTILQVALCFLFITSCTFSVYNKEKDIKEGLTTVNEFYKFRKQKNFEGINPLMSREFYATESFDRLVYFLKFQDSTLGVLKDYSMKEYKTSRTSGQVEKTIYSYTFNCKYKSRAITETFMLIKNTDNPEPKILSYRINF